MSKLFLAFVLLLVALCSFAQAQDVRLQERNAEWAGYTLPKAPFTRHASPENHFLFRVPADWKQEGATLSFKGPHASVFQVVVEKIPEGLPLTDYVAAFIKTVDSFSGAGGTALTRRTQFQDLEAREITLESPSPEGEVFHSSSWITVKGPSAIVFVFRTPVAHVQELEPYFKAIVQSVMFAHEFEINHFEQQRASIKSTSSSIAELQTVLATIDTPGAHRESAIKLLSSLFTSTPDVAVDLFLDRRPIVRAAAVEALARSVNSSLDEFLWDAVGDYEAIVAEPAARRLSGSSDLLTKLLDHSNQGLRFQVVARLWSFMSKAKQLELLHMAFSKTAVSTETPKAPRKLPLGVSVTVTELIAAVPGKAIQMGGLISQEPNIQLGLLTLMGDLTPEEFKLPLSRLMAANYDPLTIVGLQVANSRVEQLPVDLLFKLAASKNNQVSKLALQSLGYSATVSDIPRIETLVINTPKPANGNGQEAVGSTTDTEVVLAIKKIRFRNQLATAKRLGQPTASIIKTALADTRIAEFVWQCTAENSPTGLNSQTRIAVKPFAENLFPKKVTHFVAIPKPAKSVEKFYESLHGIQLDSARAQSSVFVMMGGMRHLLSSHLSAPVDTPSLFEYTGIVPDSPIVLGEWNAEGAANVPSAKRRAIVLRVNDRWRFERQVGLFQSLSGDFMDLTEYVAIGARGMAGLPAMLPFIAKEVAATVASKPDSESESRPMLQYSLVSEASINDLRIRTIQHHTLDSNWKLNKSKTYVAVAGDTVILASDLVTIHDLLTRANSQQSDDQLSENEDFKQVAGNSDDVIYFSDLRAAMASSGQIITDDSVKVKEGGSLRITGSTWENSHRLNFNESEWSKHLQSFHPKELAAPSELLPASTVAYYLMKFDIAKVWQDWSKELLGKDTADSASSIWALDFKQDVAPELGPECGIGMLNLPDLNKLDVTWTAFCKLKTNRLGEALQAGKLFREVGPTTEIAEVKIGNSKYLVATKNGFLVVSNHQNGINALSEKTRLASTRDYSRAAERVPKQIVAFGGYNLEAAIAAARDNSQDSLKAQVANVIFSLATAFHSQNFYATASASNIDAKSSVAMDREGRYAVADLNYLPRGTNITLATLDPGGIPILDQKRISSLKLKVRSKSSGPIDDIRDDIKTPEQTVAQNGANELLVTVASRRSGPDQKIQLPVADPSVSQFLKSTDEFTSDNKQVIEQARQIAGDDKDAWSVARKLGDWTFKNLTWKVVAMANASQTLATREADCTEFSQLYVSMARSIGLPARLVSGLAYTGSSFGGHEWVEVWIGRWIELDPTFGTDFVDATHIRDNSTALVTAAALNLIELEVLETTRTVADFQKAPRTLAKELTVAFGSNGQSTVEAALDLGIVTDKIMGAGEWERMTKDERNQMSSGYRRILIELLYDEDKDEFDEDTRYRLVHVQENGDLAEALCISPLDALFKLRLVKVQDSWHLLEVVQSDTGFHVVEESLKPIIHAIKEARLGRKTKAVAGSPFTRALLLSNTNTTKALEIADGALRDHPTSQDLLYLKATLLLTDEKRDDALKILTALSNAEPAYPAAIFKLASTLEYSEKEDERKKALELYQRYVAVEPGDPRGPGALGSCFERAKDTTQAEKEYRRALELDPDNSDRYYDLIHFLAGNDRIDQVSAVLDSAEKHPDAGDDIFGLVLQYLSWEFDDEIETAEKLAANQPARMKTSVNANMSLARIRIDDERPLEAIPLLNLAIQLDKKLIDPQLALAEAYLALSRWSLALKSANDALKLDDKNGEAHYSRARALARLRRSGEAMAALNTALEIQPYRLSALKEEKDFRSLSLLPAFKKRLLEAEKKLEEEKKAETQVAPVIKSPDSKP